MLGARARRQRPPRIPRDKVKGRREPFETEMRPPKRIRILVLGASASVICVDPQNTTGINTNLDPPISCASLDDNSLTPRASLTATASTDPSDVQNPPAPSLTSVASVVLPSTVPRTTHADDIRFHTCLIPEAWEKLLRESGAPQKFAEIPKGLREGFHIGLNNHSLVSTYIPPNHFKSEEHANVICTKFAQEMELGCISRPFHPDELQAQIGNFTTAPMAVVEQRPGKFRIIIDHSFPSKSLPPNFRRDIPPPSTDGSPPPPIVFDAAEV